MRDTKGRFHSVEYTLSATPKRRSKSKKKVVPNRNNPICKKRNSEELINKVFNENCLDTLHHMPDNFVDLVLTSPSYDNIRKYKGYSQFEFEKTAIELSRVLKDGGIIAWIVADETVSGSETGSSFKQPLFFKQLNLRLHDTMILERNTSAHPAKPDGLRYTSCFDYIFLFSKGRPKTVNLISDKKNKYFGIPNRGQKTDRDKNDFLVHKNKVTSKSEYSPRTNIWRYVTSTGDKISHLHPGTFTKELARDIIISFSNKLDLVYDPFSGSGTTLLIAKELDRKYCGSEVVKDYHSLILERLKD